MNMTPRAGALDVESRDTLIDIARQNRREIGVDDGRVAAPDELDERRKHSWLTDTWAKPSSRAIAPATPLMRGIAIGVHEDDRDGVEAVARASRERGARASRIGRRLDRAVGEHALVDLDRRSA